MAEACQVSPFNLGDVSGIERFFQDVATILASCWPLQPLILDMRGVSFVPPQGIIALTTVCRHWYSQTGERVHLRNLHPEVHQYLERMDMFLHCGEWVDEERALAEDQRFGRSHASSNLLELLPIAGGEAQNSKDVAAAVARAHRIVDTWFDADVRAIGRLLTMMSEITGNIVHSHDRGFVTIQRYRSANVTPLGSRVTVAVGDLGIGIRSSLHGKFSASPFASEIPLSTGSDYLLHALDLGVTRRDTAGGVGLYQVRELVNAWQGSLIIRSDGSMIRISQGGIERWDDLAEIPGTQVTIRVRGSLEGL
ncbi:MAG: hypothetical protein AB7P40_21445 [Chloroflexota bacterium]